MERRRLDAAPIEAHRPAGKFYHGFYFSRDSDTENKSSAKDVEKYEQTVGAGTTWVFFSDFWCESRTFPASHVQMDP